MQAHRTTTFGASVKPAVRDSLSPAKKSTLLKPEQVARCTSLPSPTLRSSKAVQRSVSQLLLLSSLGKRSLLGSNIFTLLICGSSQAAWLPRRPRNASFTQALSKPCSSKSSCPSTAHLDSHLGLTTLVAESEHDAFNSPPQHCPPWPSARSEDTVDFLVELGLRGAEMRGKQICRCFRDQLKFLRVCAVKGCSKDRPACKHGKARAVTVQPLNKSVGETPDSRSPATPGSPLCPPALRFSFEGPKPQDA